MRIPPYWIKQSYTGTDRQGKAATFEAWGWSLESLEAAQEDAVARAKRIFERVTSGPRSDHSGYLEYLDRPPREEIVDTIRHDGGELAIITRNGYGSLVLNAASVCFVDVDFPPPRPSGLIDALLLAFSVARRKQRKEAAEADTMRAVREWSERNPERSFRLYRTAAGLRLLFTDRTYDPTSAEVAGLFQELGSDVLYRRLTEKQQCFRARLTPKPWRCGWKEPPRRYPRDDPQAEAEHHKWLRAYETTARSFATCRLVGAIGGEPTDAQVQSVMEMHDRYTLGDRETPLA